MKSIVPVMWGNGILELDSISGAALDLGGGTLFGGRGVPAATILSTLGAGFVFYFFKGGAGGYSSDL